jgi:hypothetical protein
MKKLLLSIFASSLLFAQESKAQQATQEESTIFEQGYVPDKPLDLSGHYTQAGNLLFYPNPVVSQARVLLPYASTSVVAIDVMNLQGTILASFRYAPGSQALDVDMSTLPVGIYNVRVKENRNVDNIKVVRE